MKFALILLLVTNFKILYGQQKFSLKINTPPSLNDKKVYLLLYDYYSLNRYSKLDSTIIKNSNFSFTGNIKKPFETATLFIKNEKQSCLSRLNFVINTGINVISIIPNAKFNLSNAYSRKDTALMSSNANVIQQKLNILSNKFYKLYGKHDSSSVSSGLYLEGDKDRELVVKQLELVSQYPNEYYSLIWIYNSAQSASMARATELTITAFKKLDPKVQSTQLGREFYLRETARVKAYYSAKSNKPVPKFTVQTDAGKTFSNKALVGTPYIIAFSATWCIPCQEYQKKLLVLFHKYKKQNLKVVYFNLDDNVAIWKKHISENKLNWINVSERTKIGSSKIAKQFDVAAIPLYILVNKKGIITYNADEFHDHDYINLEDYIIEAVR